MAMIRDLIIRDNHPPGYQAIQYFFMQWFGDSETAIRMPSAIGGIITVIAVYLVGKAIFSIEAGLVAALLLAGSYQHIVYSQEARAYVLLGLANLLTLYFFVRLFIYEQFENKFKFGIIACATICLYLHYAGTMIVGLYFFAWLIALLIGEDKKQILKVGLYVFSLTALLYYRWIPVMIAHMGVTGFYWAKIPTPTSLLTTMEFLAGPGWFRAGAHWMILFAGTAFLFFQKTRKKEKWTVIKIAFLVWFVVLMSIAAVYLKSSYSESIYTNRYFIFLVPLLCLMTGYFIGNLLNRLKNNRTPTLLSVLALIAVLQGFFNRTIYTDNFDKQDFRGAVSALADQINEQAPGQYLVISSHEFFDFYLKKYRIRSKADAYLLFPREMGLAMQVIEAAAPEYIYHLEIAGEDETPVSSRLDSIYVPVSFRRFEGINLRTYRRLDKHRPRQFSSFNQNISVQGSG